MALQQPALAHRGQDLVRVLLIVAAVLAVMLALTVVFPIGGSGPSLEIAPDPAGMLPF